MPVGTVGGVREAIVLRLMRQGPQPSSFRAPRRAAPAGAACPQGPARPSGPVGPLRPSEWSRQHLSRSPQPCTPPASLPHRQSHPRSCAQRSGPLVSSLCAARRLPCPSPPGQPSGRPPAWTLWAPRLPASARRPCPLFCDITSSVGLPESSLSKKISPASAVL